MQADGGQSQPERVALILHRTSVNPARTFYQKTLIRQMLKDLSSSEIGEERELQVVVAGKIEQEHQRERFDGRN